MIKLSSEDKFLKALGARLRALRLEKGWTLEETEEHGWPNWRHLQKIESGKNMTILTLKKLSKLYKKSIAEITGDL
ncbi:MAG: helix-turn-helix domain-containing protein [Bacteriovoracaceae bacterium]|nr:helix-turn-helix domain-containing protein [Bacteriovoracaceae bacterium]